MPMHSIDANGARIPCLGMGTWTLSGEACSDLVAHALSIGYRHVDTAAAYRNERGVAAGIAAAVGRVGDVEARAAGSRVAWPSRWEDVFDANFKARLDQWIAG